MLADAPIEVNGELVWYSIPDPDVRTERVACCEFVAFVTRGIQ